MKPGYKTSEFWLAVGGQVLSLLVVIGLITSGDQAVLSSALSQALGGLGTVAASAAVVWKYIHSRSELKAQEHAASLIFFGAEEDEAAEKPDDPPEGN